MGVNPNKIHRKVTTFLRKLFWHKHCHHRLKGTETVQNEKKTAPTAFTGRKQTGKTSQLKPQAFSWGKGRTHRTEPSDTENSHRVRLSPNQRTGEMCSTGFQNCYEPLNVHFSYPTIFKQLSY